MDAITRTSLYKRTQGLLPSLFLSTLVALCVSTPIPPQDTHPWHHYDRLVRDTRVLDRHHHNLYTSFKTIRHGDASIRLDDFTISGVPSVNDLPSPVDRYAMVESELLPIHYTQLEAFEQILAQAIEDEFTLRMAGEENFYNSMRTVLTLLQRVVSKLRQTMIALDIDHDFNTTSTVTFSNNQQHSFLNMRILFILQEFSANLAPALEDFVNFMGTHTQPSS
ncbi:uncharacterized protein LOC110976437 [Acanthaster planci]|uniref:Uncharacterized protein LOC110976437 n=1 Tax=Acanthaster planci TaxID=133434 RepID=A0A8B7Y084_ACAPL|nr:uncharacterized protein LOC110976437 [Acanthaster planci]